LKALLVDREPLLAMAVKARALAMPGATNVVADFCQEIASR
jgi:UDP-N-acetylglucosamine--N-acetylmuramyl-(pentapeptide) pyrophosphoryl-undecaprenol N-acetylglucosamine transferase